MASIDADLKAAIVRMPVSEKDKLLLRLAAKDAKLLRRLEFELLEGGETRDERAALVRQKIESELPQKDAKHLTPGLLLMEFRYWSGRINEHVAATKDKPGEVILTVFMLAEGFRRHQAMLHKMPRRADTLAPYVVRRVAALLTKADKLHEDYQMEYRRDLNEVLDFIWSYSPMAQLAKTLQLQRQL